MHVPTTVALYILNQKRDALARIEARYGLRVAFGRDDSLIPPAYRLERTRARTTGEPLPAPQPQAPVIELEEGIEVEATEAVEAEGEAEHAHAEAGEMAAAGDEHERGDGEGDGGQRRRRRRRRRRGRGDERGAAVMHHERPAPDSEDLQPAQAEAGALPEAEIHAEEGAAEPAGAPESAEAHADGGGERRRRRGRRGGRRRGRRGPDGQPLAAPGQEPIVDPHATDVAHASFAQDANAPSFEAPETYRPHRVEGPGDAYDWPWNRRAERFPEEQDLIAEEAPRQPEQQTAFVEPERHAAAEHAAQPEPTAPVEAEPATVEPARTEAESAPERSSDTTVTAETSAQPEEPAGPPRRGWWRRLTQ
jgi:ribonuclease E